MPPPSLIPARQAPGQQGYLQRQDFQRETQPPGPQLDDAEIDYYLAPPVGDAACLPAGGYGGYTALTSISRLYPPAIVPLEVTRYTNWESRVYCELIINSTVGEEGPLGLSYRIGMENATHRGGLGGPDTFDPLEARVPIGEITNLQTGLKEYPSLWGFTLEAAEEANAAGYTSRIQKETAMGDIIIKTGGRLPYKTKSERTLTLDQWKTAADRFVKTLKKHLRLASPILTAAYIDDVEQHFDYLRNRPHMEAHAAALIRFDVDKRGWAHTGRFWLGKSDPTTLQGVANDGLEKSCSIMKARLDEVEAKLKKAQSGSQ